MRIKIIAFVLVGICLCSCNSIPDKSIFESLSTNELAKIIKKDTLFIDFYESLQKGASEFNEIEKARFNDITYRRLYKVITYSRDTTRLSPLRNEWMLEWKGKFGVYYDKVDSVLNYWAEYKQANSLDRFAKIEFAELHKEYYYYSSDVKDVKFGFRITPLQGTIEQIKFNYRYSAKIENFFGEKHRCICTIPISNPKVVYWEVEYSDEKRLKKTSTSEFARDYDIAIEITDIRKDGINYSIDDWNIPSSVLKALDTDSLKYPYLYESYKESVIQDILCHDYKSEYGYIAFKYEVLIKEKFPRESAFFEYLDTKSY